MRPFQLALLVGFGLIAVIGLIIFSTYKGSSSTETEIVAGGITVWGTLPQDVFTTVINEISRTDERFKQVSYVQKDERTFDLDLLKAAANGQSPDLIVAPSDYLYTWMPRLYVLPYASFPKRTFQDTYIDGAEIFLGVDGVYGIPFAVDPLVLYWNRDLLSTAGFVVPPTTYEDLLSTYVPKLSVVDAGLRVAQSAIALGDFTNIPRAKDIFTLLMLQAGSTIVQQRDDGAYEVTFADQPTTGTIPGVAAAQFFYEFADPTSAFYSWNRALPNDTDMFIANQLAMRFGFASEFATLRARNPNLNFDTALVPQNAGATVKRGYGMFYGFAIPKQAKNPNGSIFVATTLAGEATAASLAMKLQMAPVHRATLAQGTQAGPAETVRYTAAITARGWLDPNPVGSAEVFRDIFEQMATGRAGASSAVNDARHRLGALFTR